MGNDNKSGFSKPNLNAVKDAKAKEQNKADAIAELMKENIKRTNLSAPVSVLQTISTLKDCLMRHEGRKITLDMLYMEGLIDLIEKYKNKEGSYLMEDHATFMKIYAALGMDKKTIGNQD